MSIRLDPATPCHAEAPRRREQSRAPATSFALGRRAHSTPPAAWSRPGDSSTCRSMLEALTERVAALEGAGGASPTRACGQSRQKEAPPLASADDDKTPAPAAERAAAKSDPEPGRRGRKTVKAKPTGERVALHDEMIAVLREQGPMTAARAGGCHRAERGRYAPPRSGKPLDAAMVSQRVSNPTYRSRFVRDEGRIGLAG